MAALDKDEVRKEIRRLIFDVLQKKKSPVKIEEIKEGVSLVGQLGIDSLDILQIMATVEKKYGLKIPEAEMPDLVNVGRILAAVEKNWPK